MDNNQSAPVQVEQTGAATIDLERTTDFSAPSKIIPADGQEDFAGFYRRRIFLSSFLPTVALIVSFLLLFIQVPNPSGSEWLTSRIPLLCLVLWAGLVTLSIPRTKDMKRLRRWEVLVMITMLGIGLMLYHDSNYVPPRLANFAERGIRDVKVLARYLAMPWVLIIICYGLLIPNSGRRCAVITLTGTALMLLAAILMDRWYGPTEPVLFSLYMLEMSLPYSLAIGIALFGNTRMERLRQAVQENQKLGQYQLLKRIGIGGMGEVYQAEHRLLKRACAIKMILVEKMADPFFVKRFEREVAAVTQLRHPASIQVYDYGQSLDGSIYYVMEYLPGLTLEDVVKRSGPMPSSRVVYILKQLSGALAEAHELKLIHRDIKPGNIMLCELGGRSDVVKLLDYGLVADLKDTESQVTQVGRLLGTPAYMSPEQANGLEIGPASDLYSLGAVAYFLLTGKQLFSCLNSLQMLNAHIHQVPKPLVEFRDDIPRKLDDIVMKLLSKKPSDRYQSVRQLETVLAPLECVIPWNEADAVRWWTTYGRSANGITPTGLAGDDEVYSEFTHQVKAF